MQFRIKSHSNLYAHIFFFYLKIHLNDKKKNEISNGHSLHLSRVAIQTGTFAVAHAIHSTTAEKKQIGWI